MEFLKKAAYFAKEPKRGTPFAAHEQAHAIALMCRTLDVSRSGYYAWRQDAPPARKQANTQLATDRARFRGQGVVSLIAA